MGLNGYLAKSTIVAALGGLLFGFDTVVISGTTSGLTATYNLSPWLKGFTVSAALWGTVVGSLLAGIPGDQYGRRDGLRTMSGRRPELVIWLLVIYIAFFAFSQGP